jgi:hypothetical protein
MPEFRRQVRLFEQQRVQRQRLVVIKDQLYHFRIGGLAALANSTGAGA